jgi:hypothetical protein
MRRRPRPLAADQNRPTVGLEELQHRIVGEIARFSAADRLERADLHDRELR